MGFISRSGVANEGLLFGESVSAHSRHIHTCVRGDIFHLLFFAEPSVDGTQIPSHTAVARAQKKYDALSGRHRSSCDEQDCGLRSTTRQQADDPDPTIPEEGGSQA